MKFCKHITSGRCHKMQRLSGRRFVFSSSSLPPHHQYFGAPYGDQLCDSFILVINMLVWGYKVYIWERPGISPWISTNCLKWHLFFILTRCCVLFHCSILEQNERVYFEASKVVLLQTMNKKEKTSACTNGLEMHMVLGKSSEGLGIH